MMKLIKRASAKNVSTFFLQALIILIGIGTLVFMLWEPHVEGRNLHATVFEIYFKDPFLAYVYAASTPFFMALHQAFTVLGAIRKNKVFSKESLRAVRTIKYCGAALVAFIAAPLAYLFIVRPGDDIAGGVAMGLFIMLVSLVVAAVATVLEGVLEDKVR